LKRLAGFTRKKGSTRRVNSKIADSTQNQRVLFSRYLATNYAWLLRGGVVKGKGVKGALCA